MNDVKLTQSYLGRIFNYGDIEILTASELGVNLLKRINEPIKYKTAMLNAKEATEHMVVMDRTGESSTNGFDVPGMIVQLGELKAKGLITDAEYNQKDRTIIQDGLQIIRRGVFIITHLHVVFVGCIDNAPHSVWAEAQQ